MGMGMSHPPNREYMKRNIIYLVNPVSGTAKKDQLLESIRKMDSPGKISSEIVITNPTGNYDLLKDKIEKEQVTDIVIIGGDGTVNQVIDSLRSTGVNFGVIPFGSGNGLANAAGIPKKPLLALDVILHGKACAVDAFLINGQFACMLSGVGFDAKVAHDFAQRARRGLLTYTQQSLLHYFKAQPYQFEVVLDQFSFFTEAFFISIANSNQFGNDFTIAPYAALNDGLLDVVIVQKMNKAKLPFAILRQIKGNNKLQQLVESITKKTVLYFQTPSLLIRNPKLAPLHVDGEPREASEEIKVEIIKNCFKLIQPA